MPFTIESRPVSFQFLNFNLILIDVANRMQTEIKEVEFFLRRKIIKDFFLKDETMLV